MAENVLRARDGDQLSLAWLMEELDPLLLAQASYRLGTDLRNVCTPRDVVHETWLVALPKLGELRLEGRWADAVLRKFLTTTLRNIVNQIRRRQIRHRAGEVSPSPVLSSSRAAGDPMDRLAAMITGASTRVRRREAQDALAAAIGTMSEDDRRIVVMRGIEQLSNQEVAASLQIAPGTCAVRFHRALKCLRERLPTSLCEWMPAEESPDP